MARLTERGVQTARSGRHSDGDGLHLVASEGGRKKWVLRYQVAGVRKDKGLGAYPAVGLKDARERATEARKLVSRGGPDRARQSRQEGREAYPNLQGDRQAMRSRALDVAAVLRPVWRPKPEVARKLYPAIRRVFDRARVILRDEHGVAMPDNPARWDDFGGDGLRDPEGADQRQSSVFATWVNA